MKPLVAVFGELRYLRPDLVLQRGADYGRIEDMLLAGRRDMEEGPLEIQRTLKEPIYWHEMDEAGKVVVKSRRGADERVEYAEVGSVLVPE